MNDPLNTEILYLFDYTFTVHVKSDHRLDVYVFQSRDQNSRSIK